ncbi:MAG: NAD(P)/FAD-dependent oxidoreductase [bacterium]|nr:NAD(P)/FAD-dependent oxidoreductase [bacterium]
MSDVIIIGAGIGGLTAGNLLAKKGHKVIIFESHTTPGGYTAGFWRKGFYFESGTVSLESTHQVFGAMKDIGVLDKISFVPQRSRFVSRILDTGADDSYENFKQVFLKAYGPERERLQAYFKEVDKMHKTMKIFMGITRPSLLSLLTAGIKMFGVYFKYRNVTLGDFTARYFPRESELYRIFKSFGYPDMAAYILGGAVATIFGGYWTVRDGMQSWADVLAENFRGLGMELLLNSPAEKIITSNGTAKGIICNGRPFYADFVISASDYKKTFLKLMDDKSSLPEDFLRKMEKAEVSEGFCVAYLGLNISNDELRASMKFPHVMYMDELPGSELRDPGDGLFFEKSSVMLYSPSLHNPKLSPEGRSCLMLMAAVPTHWMNDWGNRDRQKYTGLKEHVKQVLIKKAGNVVPGLEKHIEFSDFATPLTFERYTGNTDGATSAWSWNPKNKFYSNYMKSDVDTPVKNLFIGSCWATQIGGIPGALNAAYQCVKRIG